MAIGNYSHAKLISLIRRSQEQDTSVPVAGSNTELQFNNNGSLDGIEAFTFDGTDLKVADGRKIFFGDGGESYIHYREAVDDFMTISGSDKGIVLSGSTIQIDGTLEGASPLKIGGALQFVGSEGAASAFNFGPNNEAKIFFQTSPSNALSHIRFGSQWWPNYVGLLCQYRQLFWSRGGGATQPMPSLCQTTAIIQEK